MRTIPSRPLAALVAAAATSAMTVAPAAAAPDENPGKLLRLSYQPNGPWGDNLPSPLFGPADGPLVPGDAVPETFYVFNTTGQQARLTLTCSISRDNVFGQRLDLSYRVGSGQAQSCAGSGDGFKVPGRKATKVDVALHFLDVSTPQVGDMGQSASYSVTVTLSQIPPKGAKPQVLGVETLTSPTSADAGATTSGTTSAGDSGGGSGSTSSGATPAAKGAPSKTVNTAAPLPTAESRGATSVPVMLGLLLAGAALVGFRRRRDADR